MAKHKVNMDVYDRHIEKQYRSEYCSYLNCGNRAIWQLQPEPNCRYCQTHKEHIENRNEKNNWFKPIFTKIVGVKRKG